jgi:hypothetical protein
MDDRQAGWKARLQAYGALALWAVAAALLLNRTPYGIDESAGRAMLFLWSFVEDLANPIVTQGVPDFRAVFLVPAGLAFPGSLLAGKLLTLAYAALAAAALFRWFEREAGGEAAMLATGLWLLSPVLLEQIDRLAVGPFLLGVLLAGAFLDRGYRAAPLAFGGRYFLLMVMSLAAVTLHPAGIAFPVVVAATWLVRPPSPEGQAGEPKRFFARGERIGLPAGVAGAAICGLLLADGWPGVAWLANPVTAAAGAVIGWPAQRPDGGTPAWIAGALVCVLLALVVWKRRSALWNDTFGRMALCAAAIGLTCADAVWALLVLVIILYWGFPLLLDLRLPRLPALLRQRGLALLVLVAAATLYMSEDRRRFALIRGGPELSAEDRLIERLAAVVATATPGSRPRVASQWPARTMVACGCNTLPLPPPAGDENALLKLLAGIDYVMFDPRAPANQSLSRNLAVLGGADAETIALQAGGVIVRMRRPATAQQTDRKR